MEVKFLTYLKSQLCFTETETILDMLTSTVLAVISHLQLEGSVVKFPMLLILIIPYVWTLVSDIRIIHFSPFLIIT